LIPKLNSYFRIGCAIINAFCPPIFQDSVFEEKIVTLALEKFYTENVLQQHIEEQNLKNKKAIWREANDSTVPQFPTISKEELKLITLGPYQIKMAGYYAEEHMDVHSDYKIFVHLEDP